MKKNLRHWLLSAGTALFLSALTIIPASAAVPSGYLDSFENDTLKGWAWDSEHPDEAVTVQLTLTRTDGPGRATVITQTADEPREDLTETFGSTDHGFTFKIDSTSYPTDLYLNVGILRGEELILIEDTLLRKSDGTIERLADSRISENQVAGSGEQALPGPTLQKIETPGSEVRGEYLGTFTITAYCACFDCSGDNTLTYSGTVPRSNHTIAADLTLYPIGTKLLIGDIIYTVEDKGGAIQGNKLDIYFDTHEEALDYGTKYNVDVYAVK